jgi:L-alanine-DL-glutamate epimerase-like enolase superfamily enzyme
MKIRSIEPIVLKIPFKAGTASTGFGDKPWTSYDMLVVRVETDDGIAGWGESWGYGIIPGTKATIEHVVAPHFIGRDAIPFANLFEEMRYKLHLFGRNGTINYALAGIEIALWDIWGKQVGRPVHALLGEAHRLQFSAYASLMPYRDPALVGEITAKAVAEGYPSVKLHEIDIPQVRAARAAGGEGLELTVDTNCPWTLGQAQAMAQQMREFRIHWLEEPIWPPENFTALAQLKRESGVAIAAGENVGTVREFETLLSLDAVTYAQPSVTKIGGIAEARKVYSLAAARNIAVAPHSPYFGPGLAATLHLAATLSYPVKIERVYIELEASPFGPMIEVHAGSMSVPDGPGLGIDPDGELLRKYRVAD